MLLLLPTVPVLSPSAQSLLELIRDVCGGGEDLPSTHSLSVASRGWRYGNRREQSEHSLDAADTCPIQVQHSRSHRHGLGAHTSNKPHPAQYTEKVPFSTNWTYTQQTTGEMPLSANGAGKLGVHTTEGLQLNLSLYISSQTAPQISMLRR